MTSNSPSYTHNAAGYRKWSVNVDEDKIVVYVHRLLAVAEFGFEAVVGNDVHHKNGCPFDNRPNNIETLSHSEHTSKHLLTRYEGDNAPWRREETLREMYCERGFSLKDLGELWGVSDRTVSRWMQRYGIERRAPGGTDPHGPTPEEQLPLTAF